MSSGGHNNVNVKARAERRRQEVLHRTNQGQSLTTIVSALGVTERTIHRDRVALGIAGTNPPQLTATEKARARMLLDDGASYIETARTLGRSDKAIARHFPGYGWTRQQGNEYRDAMRAEKKATR